MNRSRRLATCLAAASLVVLAACAPPEDDEDEGTTESGVEAAEATSAEDFGGMEGLIEAAQEEGDLNVIALPPDWANYVEIIEAFSKKYEGLTVKAVRATTGGIFQRLNQDLRANNTVASVVSMSGIGDHYGLLMRDKHLASYVPPSASKIIGAAKPRRRAGMRILTGRRRPRRSAAMSIIWPLVRTSSEPTS